MGLIEILVIGACVCCVLSAMGKLPLWAAVGLLCIVEVVRSFGH